MRSRVVFAAMSLVCLVLIGPDRIYSEAQAGSKAIQTNKDRCLTIAVQGQIAPSEPGRSYTTTWDGKPKMAIGTGGINYNLKIGGEIFG